MINFGLGFLAGFVTSVLIVAVLLWYGVTHNVRF